jgi:myotubularin-related protein 6/7/8
MPDPRIDISSPDELRAISVNFFLFVDVLLKRFLKASITRSSQPMVGLTANRSIQDEKLIEAVFQTHHSPESRVASHVPPVYGATTTNLIIDARPTTNAMANTAKGAGTENMDNYKDAKKAYLGIDHIHTMRESLAKVVEALRGVQVSGLDGRSLEDASVGEGDTSLIVLDRDALRRSGWLKHISTILEGTVLIVRNVHVNSSHVLIHCSDGWDRTSQLSSMAQVCLDPFYRTIRGFQILIEKDWVSFGHKFLDRCGHLSSEKFFLAPVESGSSGSGAEAAQAFFASVQNRFASPNHLREMSPVFHQFLETVRQVQRQFPERFEFNERYLQQLHYHLYSCQFGTFLFNSEKERRVGEDGSRPPCELTVSVWDWLNNPSEVERNLNPSYDPSLDDLNRRDSTSDLGVLIPNPKDVRFWHELYSRTDEEMNGRFVTAQNLGAEFPTSVEGQDDDQNLRGGTPSKVLLPPSPALSPSPTSVRLNAAASSMVSSQRSISPLPVDFSTPEKKTNTDPTTLKSPSTFSLQTQTSSSSLRSPSPLPRQNSDIFSSGGAKSIWGRLSNNASAAISAVQGAYEGVSRDIRALSVNQSEGGSQRDGELRSRDELNAWSPEEPSPRLPNYGSSSAGSLSANPWATVRASPGLSTSTFIDNPWSSVRESRSPSHPSIARSRLLYEEPEGLPYDPNVAIPRSSRISPTQTISSVRNNSGSVPKSTQDDATVQSLPLDKNVDPLGVGL